MWSALFFTLSDHVDCINNQLPRNDNSIRWIIQHKMYNDHKCVRALKAFLYARRLR